ncbi:MAG: alpha/beta hydrolase [Deltaproteobacteria bacterium]|nr:alpha/beta hydrolase [Deltaproteobacteria bacterium]
MRKSLRAFGKAVASISKDRYIAALNGVVGNSLEKQKSRFSIEMDFYANGKSIDWIRMGPKITEKICVFVHGSCDNEESWQSHKGYGLILQKKLGYTPLYVRYNSGLHISTNGQKLSRLLRKLFRSHSEKIKEMVLIGHSMGGLVIRSAGYYGKKGHEKWVKKVSKIFLLGAPHSGSHVEKLGNLATNVLKTIPNFYTKIIAKLGNIRSDGIKDLRHGYLVDEDWKGKDPDPLLGMGRSVPLLDGVHYYIIAATLSKNPESLMAQLWGDGMVHPSSATGKSFLMSNPIAFPKENLRIFAGVSHIGLTHNSHVGRQIVEWCRTGVSQ